MESPTIPPESPPESPRLRIRRAERRDAPRLMEMAAALARSHGDAATPSRRSIERDLFGRSACGLALVAERGGRLIGYALLSCVPHPQWGERLMNLNHLYVEEGLRGRGIGRHLVAEAVAEARRQECGRIIVGTHAENLRAQALYQSLGFLPRPDGGPRFGLDLPADGALPAGWV